MKDKIITFIVGLLVGAIITASCFLIFGKSKSNNIKNFRDGMNPEEMMNMTDEERMNRKNRNFNELPPDVPDEKSNSNEANV